MSSTDDMLVLSTLVLIPVCSGEKVKNAVGLGGDK